MSGTNTGANIKCEDLRLAAFGDVPSTFQQLGGEVLFTPKAVRFVNTTDVDIEFNIYKDKVSPRLSSLSAFTFDLQTNNICMVPGDVINYRYAASAPSSGNVWVEVYYT